MIYLLPIGRLYIKMKVCFCITLHLFSTILWNEINYKSDYLITLNRT